MKKEMSYEEIGKMMWKEYGGPMSATDIIIRYTQKDSGTSHHKKGIVLIDRKYSPLGIAMPGGMAEHMTYEENAVKEAKEETGLDVILDNPKRPYMVVSNIDGDPRAHISSIVYTAKGSGTLKPKANEDAKSAMLVSIGELEKLLQQKDVWAFERHRIILSEYLKDWKTYDHISHDGGYS